MSVKQAKEQTLARIELIKERIYALNFAVGENRNSGFLGQTHNDYSSLYSHLYKQLNDAYGIYFMWIIGIGNKEEYKKAREIAYNKYLTERKEIMSYLEIDGEPPGAYPSKNKEDFQKDIKKHFIDMDKNN